MAPEVIRNEVCNEKVDIWSFGVCVWELLTCEVPYRNVDSSAIIWGVGSNSLQLPIPRTCPDGYKLLMKQCWSAKPRNRPSFKHILMHLEIAAVEVLSYTPDDYFKTQQSWKDEVWEAKKKLKPLVISKAQERFHKKGLKYAAPSSEGRSTSPESPFKLPLPYCSQPQSPQGAARCAATASGSSAYPASQYNQ